MDGHELPALSDIGTTLSNKKQELLQKLQNVDERIANSHNGSGNISTNTQEQYLRALVQSLEIDNDKLERRLLKKEAKLNQTEAENRKILLELEHKNQLLKEQKDVNELLKKQLSEADKQVEDWQTKYHRLQHAFEHDKAELKLTLAKVSALETDIDRRKTTMKLLLRKNGTVLSGDRSTLERPRVENEPMPVSSRTAAKEKHRHSVSLVPEAGSNLSEEEHNGETKRKRLERGRTAPDHNNIRELATEQIPDEVLTSGVIHRGRCSACDCPKFSPVLDGPKCSNCPHYAAHHKALNKPGTRGSSKDAATPTNTATAPLNSSTQSTNGASSTSMDRSKRKSLSIIDNQMTPRDTGSSSRRSNSTTPRGNSISTSMKDDSEKGKDMRISRSKGREDSDDKQPTGGNFVPKIETLEPHANDEKDNQKLDISETESKLRRPSPKEETTEEIRSNLDDGWLLEFKDLRFKVQLGRGISSTVYKGTWQGKVVAIKVLRLDEKEKDLNDFKKELYIMSQLRSPHIVPFHGATLQPKLCIVMELCENGSLYNYMIKPDSEVTWDRVLRWTEETVEGINTLHSWKPPIVHRDLKTLNLLLDSNFVIKVCDFGLSRYTDPEDDTDQTLQKLRGTYAYTAPEMYKGVNKVYTQKSDIYSLGVIIWEMSSRLIKNKHCKPYSEYPEIRYDYQIIIQAALGKRPTILPECHKHVRSLIEKCWQADPDKRPSCPDLLDELKKLRKYYEKKKGKFYVPAVTSSTVAQGNSTPSFGPTSPRSKSGKSILETVKKT